MVHAVVERGGCNACYDSVCLLQGVQVGLCNKRAVKAAAELIVSGVPKAEMKHLCSKSKLCAPPLCHNSSRGSEVTVLVLAINHLMLFA